MSNYRFFYEKFIAVNPENLAGIELRVFAVYKKEYTYHAITQYFGCTEDGRVFATASKNEDLTIDNVWIERNYSSALGSPYLKVSIGKTVYLHRIIAFCWCYKPKGYSTMDVNHIDSVKSNCSAFNLEFVSHQENTAKRLPMAKPKRGTIFAIELSNGKFYEFANQNIAAEASGVNQSMISTCLRSKRKTAGGMLWFDYNELYAALSAMKKEEVAI